MKQDGFTLLELLITLLIISLLILLVIPPISREVEQGDIKQFFRQLDADILYLQYDSFHSSDQKYIAFEKDYYIFKNDSDSIRRPYPADITFYFHQNYRISFNHQGTFLDPGTYLFRNGKDLYEVIFPLGKGGHYVQKDGRIFSY